MSEYVTVRGAKRAYVDGEIGEAELEAEVERLLEKRERTHNMVEAGYAVAVAGVVLKVLTELDEQDGGEK